MEHECKHTVQPADQFLFSTTSVTSARGTCIDCPQDHRWGVWESEADCGDAADGRRFFVHLGVAGKEVSGCFQTRSEALAFQAEQLASHLRWPRQPLVAEPERSPLWDHSQELEDLKEYSFLNAYASLSGEVDGLKLRQAELRQFNERGFLCGVPILSSDELEQARLDFDELLSERIDRAPTDEAKFRSAHTIARPLHQPLVARLATHPQVINVVEDLIGPQVACWSAHLFCKLPGDPTEQPWHQDAGFWPLNRSRALTVWIAFDDVDESNSSVTFLEGSHRLGRVQWQTTESTHHLLTSEIPDADLLGSAVPSVLRAGEASVHSDLTVHRSRGNCSSRRRAGLALRYVRSEADCLGPMINGYRMNGGCILPRGQKSDPRGHWKALRRRPGGRRAPRWKKQECQDESKAEQAEELAANQLDVAGKPCEQLGLQDVDNP